MRRTMVPLAMLLVGLLALGAESAIQRGLLQTPTVFPPHCKCDVVPTHSPYRLMFKSSVAIVGGSVSCFDVYTVPCDASIYCCVQDLWKVEYDIGE